MSVDREPRQVKARAQRTFSSQLPRLSLSFLRKRPLPIHSICHISQCMLEGKWEVRGTFPSAYPRTFLIFVKVW